VEPSVFIYPEDQEVSVFDRSRAGAAVATERWDAPGQEAAHGAAGGGQENDNDAEVRPPVLLAGDTSGDWSWKPGRHPQDPGCKLTRKEIDAWVAEGMPRLRKESAARVAQLEAQMRTFRGVPPSVAESRPRGPEPGAKFYGIPEHMVNETAEEFHTRIREGRESRGEQRGSLIPSVKGPGFYDTRSGVHLSDQQAQRSLLTELSA
jgi:hypothetical protein